jgi:serine protein kinase
MNENRSTLRTLVAEQLDPETYAALTWEGSFDEYLAIAERNPAVARNAWQRLVDMIDYHGYEQPAGRGVPPRWRIFEDPFDRGRDAVYGLDEPLNQLVQIFRAGAQGLGPEKRVVLLHGPVGSAKSTIVRLLKRGLEAYAYTDAGAIYTFSWHVDGEVVPSPMHQDPLLLIPPEARASVERCLNESLGRD